MKRIAVLVAGAFLLQQFAPTMLWAETLADAISSPTTAGYTLSDDENVSADLPAYGTGKTEFSVDGDDHILSGSNGTPNTGVNGFVVANGQTLNLTDITLSGFVEDGWDGSEPPTHFAVINDGTVNVAGTVTNNSVFGYTGLAEEEDPQGTVNITGTMNNNSAIAQKDVVVASGATLNTDFDNLIISSLTNSGTINVGGGETGDFEFTGTGTMNVQGNFTVRDNFSQGTVNVESGHTFTMDAAKGGVPVSVEADTFNNEGTVKLNQSNDTLTATFNNGGNVQLRQNTTLYANGGTNTGTIDGNGTGEYGNLVVQGAYATGTQTPLAFVNTGTITVDALTIAAATSEAPAGQLTTNLNAVTLNDGNKNWITNNGVLNLTGGTNEREIKGNGEGIINIVSGTVTNGGSSKGTFTNQSELNIYEGAAFNNANADAMTFGSLTNSGTLTNANSLTITDGSNAAGATIAGAGDLFVNGVFANNNATAGAIAQNVLTIGTEGQFTTNAGAVSVPHFTNDGTLVLTGGTNSNTIKDTTVKNNPSATPTAGTTQIAGDVLNNDWIYQKNIEIASAGKLTTDAGHLKTADNAVKNLGTLVFNSGNNANAIDGTYTVTDEITGDETTVVAGTVIFKDHANVNWNTVNQATIQIGTADDEETFTFQNYTDAMTGRLVNYGALNTSTGQIRILGTEENPSYNYGTIVGDGGPVSPSGVSHVSLEEGAYLVNLGNAASGYDIDAMRIEGGATLETAAGRVGDILNRGTVILDDGTQNATISYAKSDVAPYADPSVVYPVDGTVIVRGNVINEGLIKQQTITIAAADTEKGTDAGSLQTKADIITAETIENNGTLTLTGTSGQQVHSTNTITGDGTLSIQNTIVNDASITQGLLSIAEGDNRLVNKQTVTAALANAANIDNEGTLTVLGTQADPSTNSGVISYAGGTPLGTLNIEGYLNNTGKLSQNAITVAAGGTLVSDVLASDQSRAFQANTFTNNGTFVLGGEGALTQAIVGTGTTQIAGNITNEEEIHQGTLEVQNGAALQSIADDLQVTNLYNDGALTFVTEGEVTSYLQSNINNKAQDGTTGAVDIQGKVNANDKTIDQKSLQITSGELIANASNLAVADGITNAAILTLNGGTNANGITGDEGVLNITGTVGNQADVTQKSITVADGAAFTHSSGIISASLNNQGAFTNDATLYITGQDSEETDSVNDSTLNGTGSVVVKNGASFQNNGSFTQNSLTIEGGSLITDFDDLTIAQNKITNNGDLYVTGGTVDMEVTKGEGSTGNFNVGGNVVVAAGTTVNQQNINIVNIPANGEDPAIVGRLTANASDLTGDITNDNILEWTGGDNLNEVTGEGNILVSGAVANAAGAQLNNTVEITSGNSLLAQAGDLLQTVTNQGVLTLTGINAATHENQVAISGDGTLEIDGTVGNKTGAQIANALSITSGSQFVAHADDVLNNSVTNDGTFQVTGGTLDQTIGFTADTEDPTHTAGTLQIAGTVDVDGANITQKTLKIANGGVLNTALAALDNIGTISNAGTLNINQNGTIERNFADENGRFEINGALVNNAQLSQDQIVIANGSLETAADKVAAATLFENDAVLTLTGGENSNVLTGTGSTQITGAVTNSGSLSQTSLSINEGASLNTAADDVTAAIANEGTLQLTGGTNANTVTGAGETQILGAVSNSASLVQKTLTITSAGTLETAMADVAADTLTNDGTFQVTDGNITQAIYNVAGDNATGTVQIMGATQLTGDGVLKQNTLTIDNTGTFTADMSALDVSTLTNNGIFNVTGDIATDITGTTGTLNIQNNLQNTAQIHQKIITVASAKTVTTDAGNLTATQEITNSGKLSFTGGTNANVINGGEVEVAGSVINAGGKTLDAAVTVLQESRLQANATDLAQAVTNDGTLALTGGTIAHNVGYTAASSAAKAGATQITGTVELDGGTIDQKTLTVNNGAEFTASLADVDDATVVTNNGLFHVTAIDQDVTGNGTLDIQGDLTNNNVLTQNALTIASGNALTTAANNVTAAITNGGTLTLTEGTNANAISGNGTLKIAGDVVNQNGVNIANNITVQAAKSLTAMADDLAGTVTNNGIVALTGGTLNQSLAGTTNIVGNVALGSAATTFDSLMVAGGKELAMNEVQATVDNATINGTLNMGISQIAADSSDYTGAKLTATNGVTLGDASALRLTFLGDAATQLKDGQSTGELELINGDVTGNWASTLANNRYKITANQGKATVSYTTSAEEVAQEAGANGNEVAAAGAWDKEDSLTNPTAAALNNLSQTNAAQYVEALEDLAPVQVPMVKTNVTGINNSIYVAANNHMQYGGKGLAAGDGFSYKSVWMQGLYNKAKNDVHGGFDGDTYGGAVGVDVTNDDDTTLGIGYAYAYSSLNAEGKKIKADTQNIFLYGNYTGLEDWYFDGTIGYNFGKYKETKNVTGVGTGKGDYHVNSLAAQAMAQYQLTEYFAPLAGLRYVYAHQGSYDDGLGQNIASAQDHTLTALLGMKAGRNFQAGKLVLKPEVKVAALFDVMQHGDDITVSTGNNSYSVKTEQLKKFGVEGGVNLGMDLTDHLELTLGYSGQFRSHYYNHTGSAKLKYSF